MPAVKGNPVWLTWYEHRRTRSLCELWQIPIELYAYTDLRLLRRPAQVFMTLRSLWRHRRGTIFVPNPSIGLVVLAVLLKKVFGYPLIVDAHNEGVQPFVRSGWLWVQLTNWVINSADVTIVTNEYLAERVRAVGGAPVVLPDPLPQIREAESGRERPAGSPRFLVVATYAADEPVDAVLEAARKAGPELEFRFSGRMPRRLSERHGGLPANVVRLGFIDDQTYFSEMRFATAVIDLTLMPDCLVCGAYEAMATETPLILSEGRAIREIVSEGAEFVDNSADSIKAAAEAIAEDTQAYRTGIRQAAAHYRELWQEYEGAALRIINAVASKEESRNEVR